MLVGEGVIGAVPHQLELEQAAHNPAHKISRRLLAGFTTAALMLTGCSARDPDSPPSPSISTQATAPGTSNGFTDRALALADPSVIGMSPADLKKRFDLIDAAGAAGIRTDLSSRFVQPNKDGPYDWSKFDPIADAAKEHGKPVTAILAYAPPWAGEKDCDAGGKRCAPKDVSQFGDFAVAAVERYAPQDAGNVPRRVHVYQLGNEQNTVFRWSPKPDAAAYAQLVREVCPRIKNADPKAVVILGGLALGDKPGDVPMLEFVKELYAANPGACWDALSVHLYNPKPESWKLLEAVHQVMDTHGDTRRIWATEIGVETSGTCGAKGNVSEILQASELAKTVDTWRSYPWTGPLMWFMPQDVTAYNSHWGLTCNDPLGTPKPALEVFKKAAAVG